MPQTWEETERTLLRDLPRPATTPGGLRGKMCLNRIPNCSYRYLVAVVAHKMSVLLSAFPPQPSYATSTALAEYLGFPEALKFVHGHVDRNGYVSVWLETYLGRLAVGHYRVVGTGDDSGA